MKKHHVLLGVLLVAAFGFVPACAMADSVNFAPLVGQTVDLTVEPYSSGENNVSFYVGLTQGEITALNGTSLGSFWMYCVDPLHEISVPTTYEVEVESLANQATTDVMGLGLATLQEQATLGLGFGITPSGNASADSTIQEAIWDLANVPGGGQVPYYDSSDVLAALSNAALISPGRNYSGSYLLNPVDGKQAFMPVATPEPTSLLLLGTGLLGMAGVLFRKMRASQHLSSC